MKLKKYLFRVAMVIALIAVTCCLLTAKNEARTTDNEYTVIVVPGPQIEDVYHETVMNNTNAISFTDISEAVEFPYSDDEVDLISLITMAEAEGESEDGKRYVIDTVLNRVDSPYFPSTVRDVVYQSGQFESVWNGRMDRCFVDPAYQELVIEEITDRSNYEIVYFNCGGYPSYGIPVMHIGNHYFSAVKEW